MLSISYSDDKDDGQFVYNHHPNDGDTPL